MLLSGCVLAFDANRVRDDLPTYVCLCCGTVILSAVSSVATEQNLKSH